MIVQRHRLHVSENTREELTVNLPVDAQVLCVHHYGLPHGYVELVEMHTEGAGTETSPRRFMVIDAYCSAPVTVDHDKLRYIDKLPFDNHVWTFFELLD